MKLIIDIPEELFNKVKLRVCEDGYIGSDVWMAVANGTPYEERPIIADEDKKPLTNGDTWKSYCEGQEVGFKKAEYVFERMKLIQETVDCIRNTFNQDTESDKLVRNCMALVQNAIDGEYHDMEDVDVSKIERPQGEWIWSPVADDGTVSGCCSKCSFSHMFIGGHTAQYNFCPNCGAKMTGGVKNDS